MRKLGKFMVVTTIAFSGTRALYAILMLSFNATEGEKYFCMLGRELGFLVLCCLVLFGKKKMLEFMTSVAPIVLASAIYFSFILWLKTYVYGPVLDDFKAGLVSTALVLLPIAVIEVKQEFLN